MFRKDAYTKIIQENQTSTLGKLAIWMLVGADLIIAIVLLTILYKFIT